MIIKHPTCDAVPCLKALWREAFDDGDFSDVFFSTVFEPSHALAAIIDGDIAGALYFLDCEYSGIPVAYVYAVATSKRYRGRGVCRALMEECHRILKERGYGFVILKPGSDELFSLYGKLGYMTCGYFCSVTADADGTADIREISKEEYSLLRQGSLPRNGVDVGDKFLEFAAEYMHFFAGDGYVFTAHTDDNELYCAELIGKEPTLSSVVGALGCRKGHFRLEGNEPFIMGHPLKCECPDDLRFTLTFD